MVPTASPQMTRLMFPAFCRLKTTKGKPVIPAQGDGCCIHYFKVFCQDIGITYFFIHDGIGILDRIPVINAIHLGRLEDDIGLDLDGAEGCRGVGRKIGISRSGGKDHHPSLLQVADGPPLDERFGDLLHFDGRLHPRGDTQVVPGRSGGQGC